MLTITNEQRAKIFMKYIGQKFRYDGSVGQVREVIGVNHGWGILDYVSKDSFRVDRCRLLLTPLDKLSNDMILELCQLINPEIFGVYCYAKWEVIPDKDNQLGWNMMEVRNKNSTDWFQVDLIDGQVRVFEYDESAPYSANHTYWQWYFENGIAIPLYPFGKTAIELGVAIDKTI